MVNFFQRKKDLLKKDGKKKNALKTVVETPYDIILCGLKTPKATRLLEAENTLVFMCKRTANKIEIKDAFKQIYGADIAKITTLNTQKGFKKAHIKCVEDGAAFEIASNAEIL